MLNERTLTVQLRGEVTLTHRVLYCDCSNPLAFTVKSSQQRANGVYTAHLLVDDTVENISCIAREIHAKLTAIPGITGARVWQLKS